MRILDAKALMALAQELGFVVTAEEAKVYCEAINLLENEMKEFDNSEEDRLPLFQTVRDPGCKPKREEDPFNCFITRCFVKGSGKGPLSGKSVGLKDNVSVAGVPMTLGSRFMEGFIPEIDATVVTRLLEAGADIVGKLNMDDFSKAAHGLGLGIGDYGRCCNPHAPGHLTGGSSSGSAAAVASGAVDLAIGGDQGGSIRIPAAWCGVVGLKPTHGLIPYTGVVGLEPSLDHIGPMGRTVEDVALMLECIAGPDGYDPRQMNVPPPQRYTEEIVKGIGDPRIGILREGFGDDQAEPDVEESVHRAVAILKDAGARVKEISIPEHLVCGKLMSGLSSVGYGLYLSLYGGAFMPGYYDTHLTEALGRFLKSKANLLPPPVKLCMLLNTYLGHRALKYYGKAHNIRRVYIRAYDQAFREVDCLVMPTVPIKAPRYNAPKDRDEAFRRTVLRKTIRVALRNTVPFNITGHPALSVPCGLSDGLPVGLMLVGARFSDGLLLRVAHALEQVVCGHPPASSGSLNVT